MLLCVALALAAEPPDLSGAWRLALDVASKATLPVLGTTTIRTHQIMLVGVEREVEGFAAQHDTCSLQAETRPSIASTRFPQAFVDAIPSKAYPVHLTADGDGWAVRMDLGAVAMGFDPAAGDFPNSLAGDAVIDWDKDGAPAATIQLEIPLFGSVAVYRAQTSRTLLHGVVASADLIRGSVEVTDLQQRTLGASNRLFVQNPEVSADPANSTFRLERVPAGSTCATVAAR